MQKKVKLAIIVLSALLVISTMLLAGILISNYFRNLGPTTVVVPDNLISPDVEGTALSDTVIKYSNLAVTGDARPAAVYTSSASGSEAVADVLYLYNKNADDNMPFEVTNMFPGDVETKYYCIRVSHSGDVTVHHHADIQPGYEKLAEVLKCRVVLLTTGETMYDGLMRDMPEALDHTLSATASTTSELYYEITAYLDTSVGNEYQLKTLMANFRWWIEESDNLDEPPQTGDIGVMPFAVTAAASLFLIVLLLVTRRKESGNNAE